MAALKRCASLNHHEVTPSARFSTGRLPVPPRLPEHHDQKTRKRPAPHRQTLYAARDCPATRITLQPLGWGLSWRQTADFEELQPESLDFGDDSVQRCVVRQRSRQHGLRSAQLSLQGGER
jgi:hypothetical protein